MPSAMTEVDQSVLKALRKKCSDIEDALDDEEAARDEALAAGGVLRAELEAATAELEAERELVAGNGASLVEGLRGKLAGAERDSEELDRQFDELRVHSATARAEAEGRRAGAIECAEESEGLRASVLAAVSSAAAATAEAEDAEAAAAGANAARGPGADALAKAEVAAASAGGRLQELAAAECRLRDRAEALSTEEQQMRELSRMEAVQAEALLSAEAAGEQKREERWQSEEAEAAFEARNLAARVKEAEIHAQRVREKAGYSEEELALARSVLADVALRADEAGRGLVEADRRLADGATVGEAFASEVEDARRRLLQAEAAREARNHELSEAHEELQAEHQVCMADISKALAPAEAGAEQARRELASAEQQAESTAAGHREAQGKRQSASATLERARLAFRLADEACQAGTREEERVAADSVEATQRLEEVSASSDQARAACEAFRRRHTEFEGDSVLAVGRLDELRQLHRSTGLELESDLEELEIARGKAQLLEGQRDALQAALAAQQTALEQTEAELQVERSAAAASAEGGAEDDCAELGLRIEALGAAAGGERAAADAAESALSELRSERVSLEAAQAELHSRCQEAHRRASQASATVQRCRTAAQAEGATLESTGRRFVDLEAAASEGQERLGDAEEANARAGAELSEAAAELERQLRHSDGLQEMCDRVAPEHMDLCARYSEVREQIDQMRGERGRLANDSDQLRASIERAQGEVAEALQQKAAVESAPPTQLSVSNFLIRVDVEGAATPLMMRPWETRRDLPRVVDAWLESEGKAPHLQHCLVRYLRHLDDTAESFPLVVAVSLQHVHEEFSEE